MPNVTSLVFFLLVLTPTIQTVILESFPSSEFWWSMLASAFIGAIAKWIEVKYSKAENWPPANAAMDTPARAQSNLRLWLIG